MVAIYQQLVKEYAAPYLFLHIAPKSIWNQIVYQK